MGHMAETVAGGCIEHEVRGCWMGTLALSVRGSESRWMLKAQVKHAR